MQINKSQLKKWIVALDSGEYKQTRNNLQDEYGYCCLGVACKVLIPDEKQVRSNQFLLGGMPVSQRYAPEWLKEINNRFKEKAGIPLVTLNDNGNFTFREIATLLELVYIHKILD